jgi:hypothetical protein
MTDDHNEYLKNWIFRANEDINVKRQTMRYSKLIWVV